MSKTQYEKRKAKDASVISEIEKHLDDSSVFEQEPVYTQTGYDVYTEDGGRTYKVAELKYNPQTGEAVFVGDGDISRLVALKYFNQKTALGILKTNKRGK